MTTKTKLLFISLLASLFIGCESKEASTETTSTTISMQVGTEYPVYSGDSIVKVTDNAEVNITHKIRDNSKLVTLIVGEATLIRALSN